MYNTWQGVFYVTLDGSFNSCHAKTTVLKLLMACLWALLQKTFILQVNIWCFKVVLNVWSVDIFRTAGMEFRWSEIWEVFEGFSCIENCSRKQTWQFCLCRTEPLTWKECTIVLSRNNNRYAIQFLTECKICTCLSLVTLWWKNPSIVMFGMHDICLRKQFLLCL